MITYGELLKRFDSGEKQVDIAKDIGVDRTSLPRSLRRVGFRSDGHGPTRKWVYAGDRPEHEVLSMSLIFGKASKEQVDAAKIPESQKAGIPESQNSRKPESQNSRKPESQKAGIPENQKARKPESQKVGIPESQKVGIPESQNSGKPESQKVGIPENQNSRNVVNLKKVTYIIEESIHEEIQLRALKEKKRVSEIANILLKQALKKG